MALTQFSHAPSKVAKSIRKKKGPSSTSSLHANSRDARKLNRASLRDEKLYRHALIRDKANEKYLQRVEFFKAAAEAALDSTPTQSSTAEPSPPPTITTTAVPEAGSEPEESPFTTALLSRLTTSYVSRKSAQLSALQSQRRPGRSASPQEVALQQAIADENSEFDSGFWIPDLRDRFTCDFLAMRWDGSWSALQPARFVRVARVRSGRAGKAEGGGNSDGHGDGDGDGDEAVQVTVRESKFPPKGMAGAGAGLQGASFKNVLLYSAK